MRWSKAPAGVLWTGEAHGWYVILLTAAVSVGATAVALVTRSHDGAFAILAVALPIGIALAGLFFGWTRVEIGREWIAVYASPLQVRVFRRPTSAIASVERVPVNPLKLGGWGYRVFAGGRGMIVRRGDGFHLVLSNGRSWIQTVDGADAAVAELLRQGVAAGSGSRRSTG